jgi:hypothetical protein
VRRTADLAVVPLGRSDASPPSGPPTWNFRVEHRGGAPITQLDFWSGTDQRTPASLILDGSLHFIPKVVVVAMRQGDSIEVQVQLHNPHATPFLWVAGDAVDPAPLNNGGAFERPMRRRSSESERP